MDTSQTLEIPQSEPAVPNPICDKCHTHVRPLDYYCYNCGANLHPKPPSTSLFHQFLVYLESIAFPPVGIIIGIRYLRQKDSKSRLVGITAIILTFLVCYFALAGALYVYNTINVQLNSQMQSIQGLGL